MTSASAPRAVQVSPAARRFGYGVAIAVSIVLLIVVNNVVAWDIFPWITAEFSDVVPVLNIAIIVSIAANGLYIWRDARPVKGLGELATTAAGLGGLIQLLAIFPFDFSAYSFPWTGFTRAVLILGIAGSIVGIVAAAIKAAQPTAESG